MNLENIKLLVERLREDRNWNPNKPIRDDIAKVLEDFIEQVETLEYNNSSLRLGLEAAKHNSQKDNEYLIARAKKAEAEIERLRKALEEIASQDGDRVYFHCTWFIRRALTALSLAEEVKP